MEKMISFGRRKRSKGFGKRIRDAGTPHPFERKNITAQKTEPSRGRNGNVSNAGRKEGKQSKS